ncbi:hypothetical protein SELMODRAFT_89183, partial [Selaginella moellendorffii]
VSSIENQVLVVANTHILFNPKRGDIKLGQARFDFAQELSSSWGGAQVIVAGDFNSTPSSPLYRYISTAELDVSSLDRRSISGQIADGEGGYYRNPFSKPWIRGHNPSSAGFSRINLPSGWTVEELVNATGTSSSTKVVHDLKLSSAYSEIEGKAGSRDSQGEPLVTTYHKKFKGTVDYIWHTERLRPLRVVDMLSVDVLRHTGGLPSQVKNFSWNFHSFIANFF